MADEDWELVLYVVFDHPLDFPNNFVVRQQIVRRDPNAAPGEPPPVIMGDVWIGPTLEMVRALIPPDKVRMDRSPGDDPKICEVWI